MSLAPPSPTGKQLPLSKVLISHDIYIIVRNFVGDDLHTIWLSTCCQATFEEVGEHERSDIFSCYESFESRQREEAERSWKEALKRQRAKEAERRQRSGCPCGRDVHIERCMCFASICDSPSESEDGTSQR